MRSGGERLWSERLWSVRSGGEVVEREEWSERLWSVRSGVKGCGA